MFDINSAALKAAQRHLETCSAADRSDPDTLAWDLYWSAVDALMVLGFTEKEADGPAVKAADDVMETL